MNRKIISVIVSVALILVVGLIIASIVNAIRYNSSMDQKVKEFIQTSKDPWLKTNYKECQFLPSGFGDSVMHGTLLVSLDNPVMDFVTPNTKLELVNIDLASTGQSNDLAIFVKYAPQNGKLTAQKIQIQGAVRAVFEYEEHNTVVNDISLKRK